MTDREKLAAFRDEIERLKDSCASPIVIRDTILSFIASMQEEHVDYDKLNTMLDDALSKETKESWNERLGEEPATSVWHDASEKPKEENKPIAIKLHSCEIWSPYIVEELSQGWDVFRKNVDIKEWAYCDKLSNLTHLVTKISDQEGPAWLKGLQEKLDSLSKEEFEKLLAKYDKYDEVKEPVSEDLEKAATRAAYHQYQNIESDYISENEKNKFIEGAKWKKEQMMKDAVEGKILRASLKNDEFRIVSEKIQNDNLKVGDKVKIIVIKED